MFGDFPIRCVKASPPTSTRGSVRANFDYTVHTFIFPQHVVRFTRKTHFIVCVCVYIDSTPILLVRIISQEDDPTELTFKAGDVIGILSNENPGWWLASLNSRLGYIPSNYVTPL